jgi:hypothetical protein
LAHPAIADPDGSWNQAFLHLQQHGIDKRADMSWHDYLLALVRVGASLEHALMVQYLYAAYSLGGPQVPEDYRPMVRRWQETLLTIAREEMGHLMTVQNVLTFLGAEVCFSRNEFPWDLEYFNLEPLTKFSLACYIFAEMPENHDFPEKQEIHKLVKEHLGKDLDDKSLLPVGDIYTAIIGLISDTAKIPESALRPGTYVSQATWDDWGCGYKPRPKPLDPEGNLIPDEQRKIDKGRAIVLIDAVATRTQAIAALKALSIQGEGPEYGMKEDEPAHFDRLLEIFREMTAIENQGWSPTLPVPVNASTVNRGKGREGYIESAHSRDWAELFNLRYRMLLTSLAHTFRLARLTRADEPNVRGVMMHRVFGEMYNLKTIAGILVHMPLRDGASQGNAGPPFHAPRDLGLPPGEEGCWRLHLDLLRHARSQCLQIMKHESAPRHRAYIEALLDIDKQSEAKISRILEGLRTERCHA